MSKKLRTNTTCVTPDPASLSMHKAIAALPRERVTTTTTTSAAAYTPHSLQQLAQLGVDGVQGVEHCCLAAVRPGGMVPSLLPLCLFSTTSSSSSSCTIFSQACSS